MQDLKGIFETQDTRLIQIVLVCSSVKILSVDKGFYVPGGTQLFGKFKSLKHCMKACSVTPSCLSGDFNPWLHKCYQHTNFTACNSQKSHPQFVHFSKVPCSKYRLIMSHLHIARLRAWTYIVRASTRVVVPMRALCCMRRRPKSITPASPKQVRNKLATSSFTGKLRGNVSYGFGAWRSVLR